MNAKKIKPETVNAAADQGGKDETRGPVLDSSLFGPSSEMFDKNDFMFNLMPVYVYVEDANNGFRYVKCNEICARLFGKPISGITGKSDEELFADREEVRRFRELDEAVMKSGGKREDFQEFTGADGNTRMGHFYRRAMIFDDGRRWMFGVVVDVTTEFEQKNKINAMLNAFDFASDMAKIAQFRMNLETQEISGSKTLAKLWPEKDGVFLPIVEYLIPEDYAASQEEYRKLVSGEVDSISFDYRSNFTGEIRNYRVMACIDPVGRDSEIGIIQDVTDTVAEHRKLEEILTNQMTLNSCFSEIIQDSGKNSTMIVLKTLCNRLKASRAFLLRFDTQSGFVVPDAEYHIDSNAEKLGKMPRVKLDVQSSWYKTISASDITSADNPEDPEMRPRLEAWMDVYRHFGVKSVYNARVLVNGKPWGIFGISYEEEQHKLSEYEKDFFVSSAHLMSLMRERQDTSAKVESAQSSLRTVVAQMEYGSILSKCAFFRLNRETRELTGTKNLGNLFPTNK